MPISAICRECGKTFKVGDDKAGRKLKCKCGGVIAVPKEDVEEVEDDWDAPAPLPQRTPARPSQSKAKKSAPARRKASGGLNPIVLIGGILGVLVLVGGGGLAVMLMGGGVGGVSADPLAYMPEDALVFVLVRPQRMMESPLVKGLPADVLDKPIGQVTSDNPLGLDFRKVEVAAMYMTAATATPAGGPPAGMPFSGGDRPAAFFARYSEPLDVKALLDKSQTGGETVTEETQGKQKYWRIVRSRPGLPATPSQPPGTTSSLPAPSGPTPPEGVKIAIVPLDDRTVLGGTEDLVLKILGGTKRGALAARLRGVSLNQDFVIAGLPASDTAMKSAASMVGMFARDAASTVQQSVNETKAFVAAIDLSGGTLLSVTIEASTTEGATSLETSIRDGHKKMETQYQTMSAAFRSTDAPPGAPKDLIPFADKLIAGISISRAGNEVSISVKNPGEWDAVVAALKPAIEQSQAAAREAAQRNNLRQIGLAFHNFHDSHRTFPPAQGGKGSGLSWRVHLLPYLEQGALYEQFHLDEPWDSTHNRSLVERMPPVYSSAAVAEKGKTRIVGFAGDGAPFGRDHGVGLGEVKDGSSNTILVIEAPPAKAVVWTKPEDVPFNASDPRSALGAAPGGKLYAVMMDGSVRSVADSVQPAALKAFITFAGGETVDPFSLGF